MRIEGGAKRRPLDANPTVLIVRGSGTTERDTRKEDLHMNNVSGYTNGAAKRAINTAKDAETVRGFLGHSSERVRRLAKIGLGRFEKPLQITEPKITAKASVEKIGPDFAALAAAYGEIDGETVAKLYQDKGSDEAALKRSLAARKAARAGAAKRASARKNAGEKN